MDHALSSPGLGPGMFFLERGWLSANNVIFVDDDSAAIVDTGYCIHAEQTVTLVENSIGTRPLTRILNTHLHSDHCGGNAALQARWPHLQTWIAPGQAQHVRNWDPAALSYTPTGQECPRFHADHVLEPGSEIDLGQQRWCRCMQHLAMTRIPSSCLSHSSAPSFQPTRCGRTVLGWSFRRLKESRLLPKWLPRWM